MRCSCSRVIRPHGVVMHDVIVFMLYVRPLNQTINPFNLAAGLSLEVGPDSWPMVSLPPHKLELMHRTLYWMSQECRGGTALCLLSICLHVRVVKNLFWTIKWREGLSNIALGHLYCAVQWQQSVLIPI